MRELYRRVKKRWIFKLERLAIIIYYRKIFESRLKIGNYINRVRKKRFSSFAAVCDIKSSI